MIKTDYRFEIKQLSGANSLPFLDLIAGTSGYVIIFGIWDWCQLDMLPLFAVGNLKYLLVRAVRAASLVLELSAYDIFTPHTHLLIFYIILQRYGFVHWWG